MHKPLLVFILLLSFGTAAQSSLPDNVADSLWRVWKNSNLPDSARAKAMDSYAWRGYLFTQPDSAFYYAQLEIDFINKRLTKNRNKKILLSIKSSALNTQGSSFFIRGNAALAIDYYVRSLEIKEQIDDKPGMASILNNIGLIYSDQGDYKRSMTYFKRCLEIEKSIGDSLAVGVTLSNIGSSYQSMEKDDTALQYFKEALPILEKYNDERTMAGALSNMGTIFLSRGDINKALEYQQRGLRMREKLGDQRAVSSSLVLIATIYRKQKKYSKALSLGNKALNLSQKSGAIKQSKVAAEFLWETYKLMGQFKKSLEMLELHIQLRDSIESEENRQEVIRQEFEYEYNKQAALDSATFAQKELLSEAKLARKNAESDKKDAELAAQRNKQYALFGGLALLVIFAAFMYNRFRVTRKQKRTIEKQKKKVDKEKKKSDELLLNILPQEVADELKREGKATPMSFEQATVLFTDFKGFTKVAVDMDPQELVATLNECFSAFDEIVEKHNLEKIKTIGDAYMCAGGVPVKNKTNPVDAVNVACDMISWLDKWNTRRLEQGLQSWEIRIGIHTGELVAGVIGSKKFAFDVWGDAVNVASRIESAGEPGRINISGTTQALIKDHFETEYRGEIEVKNRGAVGMYFVEITNLD
ncbi:MAG: adenylate/guanylate cyclase domain-containing protein [Fluviicola sp.]